MPRMSARAWSVQAIFLATLSLAAVLSGGWKRGLPHALPVGHGQTELRKHFLMWNGLVVFEPIAGFGDGLLFLRADLLVFERRIRQLAGQRVEHNFHDMHDGGDLVRRRVIQRLLSVFSVCVHSCIGRGPRSRSLARRIDDI
jgi:hypothetical protein